MYTHRNIWALFFLMELVMVNRGPSDADGDEVDIRSTITTIKITITNHNNDEGTRQRQLNYEQFNTSHNDEHENVNHNGKQDNNNDIKNECNGYDDDQKAAGTSGQSPVAFNKFAQHLTNF